MGIFVTVRVATRPGTPAVAEEYADRQVDDLGCELPGEHACRQGKEGTGKASR